MSQRDAFEAEEAAVKRQETKDLQDQHVVAGIFSSEEDAAKAVAMLIEEHFDPPHDLSVIVSHRRAHKTVPIRETFEAGHGGEMGALIGAVLATAGAVLSGMTIGPITLLAVGPVGAAIEAAYAGGAVGFMLGAVEGLGRSKNEADFHAAHIEEGVVWVGVHATGERAELAHRILSEAGARHFQG